MFQTLEVKQCFASVLLLAGSECQQLSAEIHKSDFLQLFLATPGRIFLSADVAQFRESEPNVQ